MIHGEVWYMMRELLRQGLSVSEVARRTGYDRKTIRRVRDAASHPPPQKRQAQGSKLDPYKSYLRQRVAAGVLNASKLFTEVQRQGYCGGVAQLRRFVHPLRPLAPQVTERFETPPGWQAQVDWTSCGRTWYQGQLRPLSAFVLTLSYSRRQYVEFTLRQDMETFLRCHLHAFHYFGGVPAELLYDNLKTAVDHRRPDGSVVWNQRFRDFADYYGFLPRACQPYRAQTKGKVERGIGYLKGNFLLGLDVTALTLGELNQAVLFWLKETADVRVHNTTREQPLARWPAEQAALHSLAGRPDYDTSYLSQRLVTREGFIAYQGCRYAVPPQYAGRVVLVKAGEDNQLRIYVGGQCVGQHILADRPGQVITTADHIAAVRRLAWYRRPGMDVPAPPSGNIAQLSWPQVEARPLAVYDQVADSTGRAVGLVERGGGEWMP